MKKEDVELLERFAWFALDKGWMEVATAFDCARNDFGDKETEVRVAVGFDGAEVGDAEFTFEVDKWIFTLDVDSVVKMLVAVADLRRQDGKV